ncbi:MAG TPA: hypothetical protein VKS60_08170 [Stellaceae bacterium]|nr:hypothetical protein [Stellaceae bacterium]
MNRKALLLALGIGTVLQIAMVLAGHYSEEVKALFALGGMGFSLVAGLLFAWSAQAGWSADLTGAAIAGGGCALIGIAVSVALGDVPATLLLLGTLSSVVTGLIGGAVGRLAFG